MMEDKRKGSIPSRRNQGRASMYRETVAFLRSLIPHRPGRHVDRTRTPQKVFGTDLTEHMLTSRYEAPAVLLGCSEYIDFHGTVQGIYRRPGAASKIQKIRCDFDEHRVLYFCDRWGQPLLDAHAVASTLKMYFRELPNPLCTYQLYDAFIDAFETSPDLDCRLFRLQQAMLKLPPAHIRTLRVLLLHLARVAKQCHRTGMTSHNLAIVWAPNILRSETLEVNPIAAQVAVSTEAAVIELLICHADKLIFKILQPTANPPPARNA